MTTEAIRKRRPFVTLLAAILVAFAMTTSSAFAADPIEVIYSGGSLVDSVATVSPATVNSLVDVTRPDVEVRYTGSWADWTYTTGEKGKSITVPTGTKTWSNTAFTLKDLIEVGGQTYDVRATIVKTVNNTSEAIVFGKRFGNRYFDVLGKTGETAHAAGLFVSMNLEIFKSGTEEKLKVKSLFFQVFDLDCSQSFTSINMNLAGSNIYIKNKGNFTLNGVGNAYINSTGIYTAPFVNVPTGADIYVDVSDLDTYNTVFGFHANAGAGICFLTKEHRVSYRSIDGSVGKESEKVISGFSPEGSSNTPDEGFVFSRWTADQEVTLKDGTTIGTGQPITMAQIQSVVVDRDLGFTAENLPLPPEWSVTTEAVNGTITESETNIPEGENRVVTFAPDEGFQLRSLTVDGVDEDIREHPLSYTFENIRADHHVRAVFERIPALEIVKSADREVYNAGDRVTYTVTVRQTEEGAEARDVVIRDALPEGLTLVEDSISGDVTVTSASSRNYELAIPSLAGELTYTYAAVTREDADAEELINVVTAAAANVPGDPAKDDAKVSSLIPKPVITKIVSNESPAVGEVVTYTISVKEPREGVELRNAVVSDPLPEGVEAVAWSAGEAAAEGEGEAGGAGGGDGDSDGAAGGAGAGDGTAGGGEGADSDAGSADASAADSGAPHADSGAAAGSPEVVVEGNEGTARIEGGVLKAEIPVLSTETVLRFRAKITASGEIVNTAELTAANFPEGPITAQAKLTASEPTPEVDEAKPADPAPPGGTDQNDEPADPGSATADASDAPAEPAGAESKPADPDPADADPGDPGSGSGEPESGAGKQTGDPKTGDETGGIALPAMLLIAAAAAVIAVIRQRRNGAE